MGDPPRPDPGAAWLALAFTIGWGVALIVLGIGGVVLLALRGADPGGGLPSDVIALVTLVQLPVMVALVPGSHLLVERLWYRRRAQEARPQGWRGVFAAWAVDPVFLVSGAALGLLVGWLPGLLAETLRDHLPWASEGSLEMIARSLTEGPLPWRALFIAEVALGAPLAEELVFRGFFWEAVRRSRGPGVALVVTSLLFALYHLDPVQSPAVLLTGLALGWLRWTSGSVWPGVVLHGVNNTLGVALVVLAPDAESQVALAVTGGLGTAVAVLLLGLVRRRHPQGAGSDAPWPGGSLS